MGQPYLRTLAKLSVICRGALLRVHKDWVKEMKVITHQPSLLWTSAKLSVISRGGLLRVHKGFGQGNESRQTSAKPFVIS